MFNIKLYLKPFDLSGIKALDERRRLGLSDGSEMRATFPTASHSLPVSENFARKYFSPDQIISNMNVKLCNLIRGDVIETDSRLEFDKNITADRIIELFEENYFAPPSGSGGGGLANNPYSNSNSAATVTGGGPSGGNPSHTNDPATGTGMRYTITGTGM